MINNFQGYLNGCTLMAMPSVVESRFDHAVIFVCGHDENGAIGLILNKPLPGVCLDELLLQLRITSQVKFASKEPLYYGGTIEMGRGFVLHTLDYKSDNTVIINDQYGVTATVDILKRIGERSGPKRYRVSLGYTGWSAGQLEREILDNHWLICDSPLDLVFDHHSNSQWKNAMTSIGAFEDYIPVCGGKA